MILSLFLLFFSCNLYSAGFSGETLVLAQNSHITFDAINFNTVIQYDENNFQRILSLYVQPVKKVVHISFADESITCHKKQLFWCVNQYHWICAEDLKAGDLLQTINEQLIPIDSVNIINKQTEIYSLTIGSPHHLYVGKNAVLAHNVPWVFAASTSLAVNAGAVEFIKASVVPLLSVIALKICDLFAKNRDKKKTKTSISAQPVFNSPQLDPDNDKNDKDKKKHPHGRYTGSEAHGKYQNGKKSPGPKDGQKALDNSYEFNAESKGRVAVENDKFVILRWTRADEYHGYVVTREELLSKHTRYSDVVKTLIENKLIKY